VHGDADGEVLDRRLGVLDLDVEVPALGEDAGVEQLILELFSRTPAVADHQIFVGVLRLGVLVEILHVRVGRRRVEVVVVLLDVLAVVALGVGESEEALLQDRVGAVPQRQREAEPTVVVGESREAVLAPPIGARARLIMAEVGPGVAVLAVVLADGAPLSLAEIRPYLRYGVRLALLSTFLLDCHRAGPGTK
jgi:hypothetical protein